MFQIDNSSTVAQMPMPSAAGTPGFFTDGNPATGQAATILPAEFMNMLMMELMSVVQAGSITPDKTKTNQVLSALNAMYAKLAGSSSQVFNVANASQTSHAVNYGQVLGLGQSWQNVTSSRALSTTYTNSTGKAIALSVTGNGTATNAGNSLTVTINGVITATFGSYGLNAAFGGEVIIPAGATYSVAAANASLSSWFELR